MDRTTETELKLLLPGPSMDSVIIQFLGQEGYQVEPAGQFDQTDAYLDSYDWVLLKNKIALRFRSNGRNHCYAVKGMADNQMGVTTRMEIEEAVDSIPEDISSIPTGRIHDMVMPKLGPREILHLITIRTQRKRHNVTCPDKTRLELVFDESSFSSTRYESSQKINGFMEMEIEFQEGDPSVLGVLSALLTRRIGLIPSPGSKLETAITRLGLTGPLLKPVPPMSLNPDDPAGRAVQKILQFQFQRMKYFLRGSMMDIDPECIHQARVYGRRIRSALKTFNSILPVPQVNYLRREIQWLSSGLGAIRDIDVFQMSLVSRIDRLQNIVSDMPERLDEWLIRKKSICRASLKKMLASVRCRRFQQRMEVFLNRRPAPARGSAEPFRSAVEFISGLLADRFRDVIRHAKKAQKQPSHSQYHRLRIEFKQVRYLAEFFHPIAPGNLSSFIQTSAKIQDCLGEMQDTVFSRGLILEFYSHLYHYSRATVSPGLLFDLGRLYQLQEQIFEDKKREFRKIYDVSVRSSLKSTLREISRNQPADEIDEPSSRN